MKRFTPPQAKVYKSTVVKCVPDDLNLQFRFTVTINDGTQDVATHEFTLDSGCVRQPDIVDTEIERRIRYEEAKTVVDHWTGHEWTFKPR